MKVISNKVLQTRSLRDQTTLNKWGYVRLCRKYLQRWTKWQFFNSCGFRVIFCTGLAPECVLLPDYSFRAKHLIFLIGASYFMVSKKRETFRLLWNLQCMLDHNNLDSRFDSKCCQHNKIKKSFLKRKKKQAELAGLQSMVQMFLIREVLVSQYSGRPPKTQKLLTLSAFTLFWHTGRSWKCWIRLFF